MYPFTHWTPMHAEFLTDWGARALPPGPSVFAVPAREPDRIDRREWNRTPS